MKELLNWVGLSCGKFFVQIPVFVRILGDGTRDVT